VDSVVYGCTDGSEVRQYESIVTIPLTGFCYILMIIVRSSCMGLLPSTSYPSEIIWTMTG